MLNPDFKDILSAFIAEKVDFLIVGGYAMAFHGYVRATGDIDLWIRGSEENAEKIWRALQNFGAPLFDLTLEDLQTPGMVFQFGVVPSRIDIITEIDGVDFETAWREYQTVEIENLQIPIIGKTQLLINKNRPADRKITMMSFGWKPSKVC